MYREKDPDFVADTRVDPAYDRPHHYLCELTDEWNAPVIPFGGLLSAIAVRAMQQELTDRAQKLRTVTTVFASQVLPGLLDIEVRLLRAGRSASQLSASVRNAETDGPGHLTVAVFGATRPGFDFTELHPPDAPPPEACPPPDEPPEAYRAWRSRAFEHFDWRRVRSHAPWETNWAAGGPAEMVRWMRYLGTPRQPDGTVDPLAIIALADTMPGSVGQKLGPGHPLFFGFSCDLTVHVFEDTRSDWFLQRICCRRAVDGYASAEIELWDIDRRLIAHGTQMMFLAFPKDAAR